MISLDSPVVAVLGDRAAKQSQAKHKAIIEGLGLRTVGDLLRHFPRRYLETGELTRVDDLAEGQMLIVVGEIAEQRGQAATRTAAAAARRTGWRPSLHTDGPDLRMTFFARKPGIVQYWAAPLRAGSAWTLRRAGGPVRPALAADQPQGVPVRGGGRGGRHRRLGGGGLPRRGPRALPDLPAQPSGVDSWDLQRAITFARSVRRRPARGAARRAAPAARPARRPDRAGLDPRTRRLRPGDGAPASATASRRRWSPSWCWPGAGPRCAGRVPRPAPAAGACSRRSTTGCPSRSPPGSGRSGEVLDAELARGWPMNRLLQGEVGSGKTVVALRAMLRVVDSGGQAALLAPTEVLAQQHHRSITALLGDLAAGRHARRVPTTAPRWRC